MVCLVARLVLALSCAEAMSVTKQFSQLLHDTKNSPKNFIVLRLAHTGSSWITAMLGAQDETYLTREAIYPMWKPEEIKKVESLGSQGIVDYLERALTRPSGNIHKQGILQIGPLTCTEVQNAKKEVGNASLVAQASSAHAFLKPETCACLRKLGADCPLKFLGMTLDPTSQGLKDNLAEIFTAVQKKHLDMPVLVYRRSNIVKHSLATGGLAENDEDGSRYSVQLHQELSVDKFMKNVAAASHEDSVLRKAASFFSRVKMVNYEDLVDNPEVVMESIFKFLDMPGHFDDWMAEMGDKHSPDDLRLLIKNFDEVEHALNISSPCLANQLRATTNQRFEPCEDEYARRHAM
jgi:hypothetical protein